MDRPIFATTSFMERSEITKKIAMRILWGLQEKGVLVPIRAGKGSRAAILMFRELIDLAEGKERKRKTR